MDIGREIGQLPGRSDRGAPWQHAEASGVQRLQRRGESRLGFPSLCRQRALTDAKGAPPDERQTPVLFQLSGRLGGLMFKSSRSD
jgi:hypothetical protein